MNFIEHISTLSKYADFQCPDPTLCYCPIIGACSYLNYTIPLNHLIEAGNDVGNHNREYHFWIEVINEAHLQTVEDIVILLDNSPPEAGLSEVRYILIFHTRKCIVHQSCTQS